MEEHRKNKSDIRQRTAKGTASSSSGSLEEIVSLLRNIDETLTKIYRGQRNSKLSNSLGINIKPKGLK